MRRGLAAVLVLAASLGLLACVGGTDPATNVRSTHATLNAHGYTNDGPATWWWEYDTVRAELGTVNDTEVCGDPPEADNRCGPAEGGSQSNQIPLSQIVSGLTPSTTYHFRACGQDVNDTKPSCGQVHSFTTTAHTASYAAQLKRYPYLTDVVGQKATVTWATDRSSTSGRIKYGKVGTESCTANTVSASRASITVNGISEYQWRATLSNLEQGAEYCYRVELGSSPAVDLLGSDPSPQFDAQLPAGSAEPFSFAVFGDWGAVGESQAGADNKGAEVMGQIAASGVRFALGTGDTANPSGTQTNYGDLVETGDNVSTIFGPPFWKKASSSIPLFEAVGNHGFNSTFLSVWPQTNAVLGSQGRYVTENYCCVNGTSPATYPSAWYAFDAGGARFYVLESAWSDNNVGTADPYKNDYDAHWTPSRAQYQWLEDDLRSHPSEVKFAFFHYPIYSSNATESSNTHLQGVNSLEGLLARYGVDIAFSGHAHNYTRNLKPYADSLVTYGTGGGGSRLQPATRCGAPVDYAIGWSYSSGGSSCGAGVPDPTSTAQVFHFLKVTVDGANVTVTPTDSQGNVFDQQTYSFPPDPPPPPLDTESPTAPGDLTADAPVSSRVDLSWTAATDNVGVAAYEIYRGGTLHTTTPGDALSYSDTAVQPGTSYTYEVRAVDRAGNASPFSAPANVTTPGGGGGGITFVGQATGTTPTTTTSFSVPILSANGNALVAPIAVQAGSSTSVTSVIDSAGNTWTKGPVGFLAGSNTRVEIWFTTAAAPVTSVTVNLSAPDLASANVSEWSGIEPSGALDASAGQGNASSTTAPTPTITTTEADTLVVGAINYPQPRTSTLTTPEFTPLSDFTVSSVKGRAAFRIASAAGDYSASWSLSGFSASGAAILALEGASP